MFATLWDMLHCILIDEKVEKEFWAFAKSQKLLTNKQIHHRHPSKQNNPLYEKQEAAYVNAITQFANSYPIPYYISEKILRVIKKHQA